MLKPLVCSLVMTVASFASIADVGALPDEVSASDGRAVREVVEAQLGALAANEPAQAFAYASPEIRSQYRDAGVFMEMVRRNYPMLIRPVSVSFFRPLASPGMITLGVHFRDHEGNLWRAIYELRQQPDKSWRIGGCAVALDDDSTTT